MPEENQKISASMLTALFGLIILPQPIRDSHSFPSQGVPNV